MQTLFNKDYTFFSGSVVNNPHSYGVHRFAGAYPPSTYHWRTLGGATVPFVNHTRAMEYYYGKNVVSVQCIVRRTLHHHCILLAGCHWLMCYFFLVWHRVYVLCGARAGRQSGVPSP